MRCLSFGDPEALHLAARLLLEDQVVVLPTETLYGFSALGRSETGLRRIEALKGMRRRSMLALVAGFDALRELVHPQQERRSLDFLRHVWPAPLTAVLRVSAPVPWGERRDTTSTAAFRVPAHPRLRQLLSKVGSPVVSTSVNRSGREALGGEGEILAAFGREPDLTFFRDRRLESAARRRGSTVIDACSWPPVVLRPGDFDLDAALRSWNPD